MYSGLRIKKVQMSSKTSSLSKDFVTSPIRILGEIFDWLFLKSDPLLMHFFQNLVHSVKM